MDELNCEVINSCTKCSAIMFPVERVSWVGTRNPLSKNGEHGTGHHIEGVLMIPACYPLFLKNIEELRTK